MAKLAIFSLFDEIARPLEGARTQNHDRSISFDIWEHISIPLFEIQKFLFFTPPYLVLTSGSPLCWWWGYQSLMTGSKWAAIFPPA